MTRIVIADDHAIVRSGLKQILTAESDFVVAGEAQNANELLKLLRQQNWDILVLDIGMPGRSGLEVLHDIKHEFPRLPVLVLSLHSPEVYAMRAIKAGASGYLNKDSAPTELVQALRKLRSGGKYLSPDMAEQLVFSLGTDTDKPLHEKLSDREYQVFCLLGAGKTVSEVANQLSLSVKTASTHRAKILEKMYMKTNADLIRYAIENHLV